MIFGVANAISMDIILITKIVDSGFRKEDRMGKHYQRVMGLVMLFFAAGLMGGTVCAAEEKNMKGWEIDSPYNSLYDVKEFEYFRAWVVGFKEEPPMKGMSPATIMIVKDGEDLIDVHLCPTWFAKPADVGIKKGDRVKIKGAWAEINEEDVFMASKVKKGDFFQFKVRLSKNGKPFWTMSKEELAWERLPDEEKNARIAKGEGPPKTKSQ
jgi:hypothetical protein